MLAKNVVFLGECLARFSFNAVWEKNEKQNTIDKEKKIEQCAGRINCLNSKILSFIYKIQLQRKQIMFKLTVQ